MRTSLAPRATAFARACQLGLTAFIAGWAATATAQSVDSVVATGLAGPHSVAVDSAGDVYVTGDGSGGSFTYAYTLKLAAATGVPVWTNQFDIQGNEGTAEAVRLDSGGNVIVAGTLNNWLREPSFGVV